MTPFGSRSPDRRNNFEQQWHHEKRSKTENILNSCTNNQSSSRNMAWHDIGWHWVLLDGGIGSITGVFEKLYYNILIISDILVWCGYNSDCRSDYFHYLHYSTGWLLGWLNGRIAGCPLAGWVCFRRI